MVKEFVAIYNHERSHLALKYKTPDEVHRKRKLTAVCSHQTRIGNLDAHLI